MTGKPPRWTYRWLYRYGFVMRRIFGYGTMDELWCALSNGMFRAEAMEHLEELEGEK